MKKIFLIFISALIINSCTSINAPINEVEANLNQKYVVLSNEYYKMLENPIIEKDRKNILNKFESFKIEVVDLKKNRRNKSANEMKIFNSFIDKLDLNIQYLNDLAE